MSTSTKVNKLKINKLLKEQYDSITPSDTELYFVLDEEDTLPSQAGQAGKYLTTNGSKASWANAGGLPSQEGNEGKFLSTDGTIPVWETIDIEGIETELSNKANKTLDNVIWDSVDIADIPVGMSELSGSGTISLEDNSLYKLTSSGNIVFSLPSITDTSKFHQIMVQLKMSTVVTIDVGTTHYFNSETPDLSKAGSYDLVWEYDNIDGHWVFGATSKGTA